ncbi:MAG: sulfurtransferase [Bacteroidota bacterium]|jgi:rhodanese-related sulfurtransferase|nr:sulfurtransferase [Bacteroidota bacterium]
MGLLSKLFGFDGDKEKAVDALNRGAAIIDVRTKAEFASAHVFGALNIPLEELPDNMELIKELNKEIVVCCASGNRSSSAVFLIGKFTDANVYDAGAWTNLK